MLALDLALALKLSININFGFSTISCEANKINIFSSVANAIRSKANVRQLSSGLLLLALELI